MASFPLPDFGMVGQGIGQFGAAAGDLITQQGYYRASQQYTSAGNIASENEDIARASGQIQMAQQKRELYKSMSSTEAAAGGAGLRGGGSIADILKSSASQGALQQALTGAQTEININNYKQQAEAYYAESSQSTAQGNAAGSRAGYDTMGGIGSMIGALAPLALAFL